MRLFFDLKTGELPYSFLLDGIPAKECLLSRSVREDGNKTILTADFVTGVRVETTLTRYPEGAWEFVNRLSDTGSAPTGILSELRDADLCLPFPEDHPVTRRAYLPDAKAGITLVAPAGNCVSGDDFLACPDKYVNSRYLSQLLPDERNAKKEFSPNGGRSSDGEHGKNAPFFCLCRQGEGVIVAVGWTGQWNASFERVAEGVAVRTGIENTNFRLLPGESFRTSSLVLLPFAGEIADGGVAWRRFVKAELCPLGKNGVPARAPFCVNLWGGMPSSEMLKRLNYVREKGYPFEYLWIDAGWYGVRNTDSADEYEGDWSHEAGNWCVNRHRHPNALADVAAQLKKDGLKLIFWLEPERAVRDSGLAAEHPEYFLTKNAESKNLLLDLGNPDAWECVHKILSDLVRRLGVDCYRQDFNTNPLPYWRKDEPEDRRSVREIKHINGLYRLWDTLLAEFPGLFIDNCASGGKRLDVETLRRSIPLWRSDAQCPANCPPEVTQANLLNYNSWMPYSGTSVGRIWGDVYAFRSCYGTSLGSNYVYSGADRFPPDEGQVPFLKRYFAEYLRVRDYFAEDFYPLTGATDAKDVWCAAQFDRPGESDGIVLAFRRPESPCPVAEFPLRGIDADAEYTVTDLDDETAVTVPGKDLAAGLRVSLPPRSSKIYLYRKKTAK